MNRTEPKLFLLGLVFISNILGCSHYPINKPLLSLDKWQANSLPAKNPDNAQDLLVILSLSGGGTRSAAFSYGVLQELQETEFEWHGRRLRLLDQLDYIFALSGSGFVAASYGLNREKFFKDFEKKFLKKNIAWGMFQYVYLNPINLVRIQSPRFGRTDAAAEYFDRLLFHGATLGDLQKRSPPEILIQATGITRGTRITFSRDFFRYICSDFESFPVSRATAASTAMIGLLTPITLHNYADQCSGDLRKKLAEIDIDPQDDPEDFQAAQKLISLMDSVNRPYIHLVDGGLTGSLSVRSAYEHFFFAREFRKSIGMPPPSLAPTILFISVDAAEEPNLKWDRHIAGPGLSTILYNSTKFMLDEYNLDTIVAIKKRSHEFQDPQTCNEVFGDAEICKSLRFHFVHLDFEGIKDPELKSKVHFLPANYSLANREVDSLIKAGREVIRDSDDLKDFIKSIK